MTLNKKNNSIVVGSAAFFVYLFYIISIWIIDLSDLICFSLNLQQKTLLSRILVIMVCVFFAFFLKDKIKFEKKDINKFYILGIILIFLLGFLKGVMPDLSYDTGNYHLIAQEPGFVNYFTQHYGLGNFQVWGFRLSDRLVYPFRRILGYRMGTLFSTMVLSLSYFQVVQILKIINKECQFKVYKKIINPLTPEFFALLIVLGQDCLTSFGSYYVDVYAFPVALEIIRLLLKAKEKNFSNLDIIYYAFLNGIWFAFKMTNIVFIIPAIIMFCVIIKKIPLRTYILSGICCILPVSIYCIYNFICTRNPIFPYFNTIFHSPYFSNNDFKDVRWGGQNLFEKILWIFYAIIKPEYRQCEIPNQFTLIYLVGLISLIGILVHKFRKKNKSGKHTIFHTELIIFVLISSVIWGLTTGIQRYFSFGMLIMAIIGYEGLEYIYSKSRMQIPIYIVTFILSIVTMIQISYVFAGREWSWRSLSINEVKNNIKYIFRDQKYSGTVDFDETDIFAVTNCELGGFAHWISPDLFVLNLSYEQYLEGNEIITFNQLKRDQFNQNVYDIQLTSFDMEKYNEQINVLGVSIEKTETIHTNIGDFIIIKLKLYE